MYAAYIRERPNSCINPCKESITWSGWDATLIKSKQSKAKHKVPPNDYDRMSLEEDTVNNPKEVKFCRAGAAEALQCSQWHIAVRDEICHPLLLPIAKAVASATELVKDEIKLGTLQRLLSPHLYDKLQVDLSSSITKFVLSVFTMEEFATGIKTMVRDDSMHSLLEGLQTKFVKADDWEFFNQKKFLKNQKIAMAEMAGWEDKDFPYSLKGLYEQDIVCMLWHHVRPGVDARTVFVVTSTFFQPRDKGDTEKVLSAMKDFVPLKEESKMQLILELIARKSYSVLDYLFAEVCKGFLSEELVDALEKIVRRIPARQVPVTALSILSKLVSEVQRGIHVLVEIKLNAILYSLRCATCPLREGPFGVFSDEVIEVVRIADLERSLQGHHFIGVHDILFGLLHSRVGDHELVRSGLSKSSPLDTPIIPPYRIYKLAGNYAMRCGGGKRIRPVARLEHLVWAVTTVIEGRECFPVEHKPLRGGRKACFPHFGLGDVNTLPGVDSWEYGGAFEHHSKPVTDCESLVQAIIDRLPLPNKIREEEEEEEETTTLSHTHPTLE